MRCRVQLQGKGMTTFTRVVQLALAAYAGSELVRLSYPEAVRALYNRKQRLRIAFCVDRLSLPAFLSDISSAIANTETGRA